MRLVLFLALLLRLLPTPAHAAEAAHCVTAGEAVATPHVEHAGHHAPADAPAGDHHAGADHDDCPHCPPTDCATQVHCSAPSLVSLAADTPQHTDLDVTHRTAELPSESWTSHDHQPPVRPPLSLA